MLLYTTGISVETTTLLFIISNISNNIKFDIYLYIYYIECLIYGQ